jgi:hypothetical protein
MEEETELMKAIAKIRKDFREARQHFRELPPYVTKLFEWGAANFPPEKFKEIIEETRIGMSETRRKIIEIWKKQSHEIVALTDKLFQEPLQLEEIEKQGPTIIGTLNEVFLTLTEELRLVQFTEAELEKISPK